jgi:hypothetical protein
VNAGVDRGAFVDTQQVVSNVCNGLLKRQLNPSEIWTTLMLCFLEMVDIPLLAKHAASGEVTLACAGVRLCTQQSVPDISLRVIGDQNRFFLQGIAAGLMPP